jgi:hypothetical protein
MSDRYAGRTDRTPAVLPLNASLQPSTCNWCGKKMLGRRNTGGPYFHSLTCAWQFATEMVKQGYRIYPGPRGPLVFGSEPADE